MKYLIASFVLTGLLHGWLVVHHRGNNLSTLSYHAVKTKRSLQIYTLSHLINGVLLWLFVNDLFSEHPQSWVILMVTAVAVIAEWAQAVIPARDKYDIPHTIFATIMAFSMWLVGILCTLFFAPSSLVFWFNIVTSAILGSFFIAVRHPPKPGFWKLQYLGQFILYFQILILV